MSLVNYIRLPDSLVLVLNNGQTAQVTKDHPNYRLVDEEIRSFGRGADVDDFLTVAAVVTKFANGRITVEGGTLFFDGTPMHDALADVILDLVADGNHSAEAFANFMVRLNANPSFRSRNQLFTYVQNHGITLNKDGSMKLYKAVDRNYKDKHSHSFDNHIGIVQEMPRSEVDDDPNHQCSAGFHAGSYEYVKGFVCYGNHLMLVDVGPENVVSVPADHNCGKIRTTKYKVVGEMPLEVFSDFDYLGENHTWDDDYDYEADEDDDPLGSEYIVHIRDEEGDISKVKVWATSYDLAKDAALDIVGGAVVALVKLDQ